MEPCETLGQLLELHLSSGSKAQHKRWTGAGSVLEIGDDNVFREHVTIHAGTERATRQRMLAVFPQLADAQIEYSWGGIIDISMNRAPASVNRRASRHPSRIAAIP